MKQNLFQEKPQLAESIPVDKWLNEPGIPPAVPLPSSAAFDVVGDEARGWLEGRKSITDLNTSSWTVHQWLHFLTSLPHDLSVAKLAELDGQFQLTSSKNSEIVHQWLLMSIRAGYQPATERLEEFLVSVGREKLIKPLYEELVKSESGKAWANERLC